MTIVIPKPDLLDILLRTLGKKRGVVMGGEKADETGSETYYVPKKESPIRALLRPSAKALPEGMIDVFALQAKNEMPGTGTGMRNVKFSSLWWPDAVPFLTVEDN